MAKRASSGVGFYIAVDAQGMAAAARDLLGLSLLLKPQTPNLEALASRAAAAECPLAASSIRKAAPLVTQTATVAETAAILLRERARWAALAGADSDVASLIDKIMKTRDGMLFLLASAKGDAGIKMLMSQWGLSGSRAGAGGFVTLQGELHVLEELARVRSTSRFRDWSRVVDATYYSMENLWQGRISQHSRKLLQLTPLGSQYLAMAQRIRFLQKAENRLSLSKNADRALIALSVAIELWSNRDNPFMTEQRRLERAGATAGAGVGLLALAAAAAAACGLVTGPGGVVCGGAVLGGSVAGGVASAVLIDKYLPENKTVTFDKYRGYVEKARKEQYQDFIEKARVLGRHDDATVMKDYTDRIDELGPERAQELYQAESQRRERATLKRAEDEYYSRHGYPPRDPVDELMMEEADRYQWHVKMAEISGEKK